jgi:hypothetical protein
VLTERDRALANRQIMWLSQDVNERGATLRDSTAFDLASWADRPGVLS